MTTVLMISPGLAEVGATVLGVGDQPAAALPPLVQRALSDPGADRSIVGLDAFMARNGSHVVWDTLLPPGTPRRNWLATLRMADEAGADVELLAG